jgi:hypothetical protein
VVRTHVKPLAALVMVLGTLALALAAPATVEARNCGKAAGAKIVTHGGLSCRTARHVYRLFKAGKPLPRGWVCGLSAGGCSKGKKSFTFRFN